MENVTTSELPDQHNIKQKLVQNKNNIESKSTKLIKNENIEKPIKSKEKENGTSKNKNNKNKAKEEKKDSVDTRVKEDDNSKVEVSKYSFYIRSSGHLIKGKNREQILHKMRGWLS